MLPAAAQILIQLRHSDEQGEVKVGEVKPLKPAGADLGSAKYAGRALAEWAQVVGECQNFYQRRKDEGVPTNRLVETPMLGVESFRMFG